MKRRLHDRADRGAAAVEMALVLPLLILLVFGILDAGRIFNAEIQLSGSAREAARAAALGNPGEVQTRAVDASPGLSGLTANVVGPQCPSPTPVDPPSVTVQVTWTSSNLIIVPDRTFTQEAEMRCGG